MSLNALYTPHFPSSPILFVCIFSADLLLPCCHLQCTASIQLSAVAQISPKKGFLSAGTYGTSVGKAAALEHQKGQRNHHLVPLIFPEVITHKNQDKSHFSLLFPTEGEHNFSGTGDFTGPVTSCSFMEPVNIDVYRKLS